jgi:hypothetical protein
MFACSSALRRDHSISSGLSSVRAWPWWPWASRLSPGLAGSGVSVSARCCSILSANHRVCFGSSLPSGKCALRYSAAKRSDNFNVIGDRHFQPLPPRSPSISMGHQLAAPARHFARSAQAGSVWPCFCAREQRCRGSPDPDGILIAHQSGQCRSGDDYTGDQRRYQRVARSHGREQPAGRAG